jgi:hypothetical protein
MKRLLIVVAILFLLSGSIAIGVKAQLISTIENYYYTVNISVYSPYGFLQRDLVHDDPDSMDSAYATETEILGNIEWMRLSIIDYNIRNNLTEEEATYHLKNGTEYESHWSTYLDRFYHDGDRGISISFIPLFPANLTVMEKFEINSESFQVQSTVLTKYSSEERETNYAPYHFESTYGIYDVDSYWDKKTGVVTEETVTIHHQHDGEEVYTITETYKIKEPSVWAIPEFPVFLVLPLPMTAIVLGALLYRKKQHKFLK